MAINPPSPSNTHLLPSLLIGVPFIDKEHDELVAQLDCLLSHPDALQDADRFSEVLSQLGSQIYAHFTHEEAFLKFLDMPEDEIASHVQTHTEILDQYTRLNFDLMNGTVPGRADVLRMIKDWIIGHVVRFDLNIKNYLPTTGEMDQMHLQA
jgi:hemerythrin-like metal-binding protein